MNRIFGADFFRELATRLAGHELGNILTLFSRDLLALGLGHLFLTFDGDLVALFGGHWLAGLVISVPVALFLKLKFFICPHLFCWVIINKFSLIFRIWSLTSRKT